MKKNWLFNKTIIISGASGGVGFSIAKRLIEKYNCNIIGIGRNEKKFLDNIQTLGDKKSNFSYYLFDVSIKENWVNFANQLQQKSIVPDMLLNNAGFMLPFEKFEKISDDEIEEIVKTNMLSYIYAIKIFMPILRKSNTPAIVNLISAAGICPIVGQSMYTSVKYALKGFTETLILEYKKEFYIGGIYPGFMKTNILNRSVISEKNTKLISHLMMPAEKAAKKIVKGISKRKKRMVIGLDGKSMGFFNRLFPSITPPLIAKVLKTSKLEMFKDVFDYKEKK